MFCWHARAELPNDSMSSSTGAPDPTAGGGINDSSTWYFDESGVQEQLRLNLAALAAYGAGGCNAFDMISTPAASTSSSTTFSLSSSTYGRLFVNNSHSDFHHCRFGRFSTRYSIDEGPITDENGFKPRNFAYRSFAHTWLENYRHLLRSKLPPFGYTTSASAATSSNHPVHSSVHSMPHHIVNGNGGGSAGGGSMQSLFPSFTPPTMHSPAPHHFPGSQIAMVFAKTYELLAARDTNGPRLLAIITEELLNSANLMVLKSRRNNRGGGLADRGVWDPYAGDFDEAADDPDAQDAQHRQQRTGASVSQSPPIWTVPLWEEVARLWTCLLLAPGFSPATRDGWRQRLLAWSQSPQAPRDEIYFFPTYSTNGPSPTEEGSAATRGSREPTSVFQLALDVSALSLEISEEFPPIPRNTLSELIRIMPADSRQCTCPFCSASMVIRRAWGAEEDFVTACLRASALHVMGFGEAATRLAVTLANLLIACLEDVSHRSAILGEMTSGPCSPTPSPLTSQPPSFVRSNSGGSGKASGLNSTSGGSGNQSRGGFKSPPPPPPPSQPQHFSPLQQRSHYSCTSAGISPSSNTTVNTSTSFSYFHFSPPSPSAPCVFPHSYHHHYQQGRHRFSSWQRMPQRPDPSQHLYCSSEVSLDCPFHEYGWLGLPGRPVISLVECLLEAASQKLQDPSRSGLSPSEYIHLALKSEVTIHPSGKTIANNTDIPMEASLSIHLTLRFATVFTDFLRLPVLESVSDSPLIINATTTTSTAHRHGDNLSRPSATISACNAFRSPPLPSTFFNAAMTPFSRLPVFFPPPPPLNYHRQSQETLRHQHPAFVNQDSAATAYRRDLGAMEGRQARLAISLILASRSTVFRMDHFMRVCDRHIHTSISLLSVSREVLAEAIGHRLHSSTSAFSLDEPAFLLNTSAVTAAATANATGITGSSNTGASLTAGTTSAAGSLGFANLLPVNFVTTPLPTNALQERISLVCAAFHLALCVTVRTAWPRVHWRRREMLGWAVSTGLLAGPPALLHLTQAWSLYASPREAVTWLAPTLLACIACVSPVSGPASSDVSTGVNGGVGVGVGARSSRSSAEGMLFLLPRIYSFFSFTPLAVEQIKIAIRQMTIQTGAEKEEDLLDPELGFGLGTPKHREGSGDESYQKAEQSKGTQNLQ
ncbi:unnamed protein product [Taenia asiatica]|uniref:DUF3437 domain-containing protein n=1 Tax=Taenia asiatica TaxID=60517 RepID=A0A158R771_TAEAS|nr:unnamed protein product [Taenia asiatica]